MSISDFGLYKRELLVLVASLVLSAPVLLWPVGQGVGVWGALVALTLLIARAARIATRRIDEKRGVHPSLPGPLGALIALTIAFKWWLSSTKAIPGSVSYSTAEADDATIAVIMGEGIAPAKMDFFNDAVHSMPRLTSLSDDPSDPFRLFVKRGISAGVASNSSVAGFLSGSPFPWRTEGARTLFELASKQDFSTAYFSGQDGSPLRVLGGTRYVDSKFSREDARDVFRTRRDWMLIDKLDATPISAREFFFVYPCCNHAPHTNHDPEAAGSSAKTADRAQIVKNYEQGMRVFDRFCADFIAKLKRRTQGAVFVYITSDHNELLGEDGLWGHNLSGFPICSDVGMLLYTNRPDHPAARSFAEAGSPSAYDLAAQIMMVMGVTPKATPDPAATAYVCNSIPFARGGYMHVRGSGVEREVDHYDRNGVLIRTSRYRMPGSRTANDKEPAISADGLETADR